MALPFAQLPCAARPAVLAIALPGPLRFAGLMLQGASAGLALHCHGRP
jgi:hypothetical protein